MLSYTMITILSLPILAISMVGRPLIKYWAQARQQFQTKNSYLSSIVRNPNGSQTVAWIAMVIVLCTSGVTYSQNYMVSGAGSPEVNGVYVNDGANHYTKGGSTVFYIYYADFAWVISPSDGAPFFESYYFSFGDPSTLPTSNWYSNYGMDPAPSIQIAQAVLTYSRTQFLESSLNNGTIDNSSPIIITHNNYGGDSFTGTDGENFVANGKVIVSNLPTGLTAVITKTSSTTLSVALNGQVSQHAHANSISDLTFSFQNSAFTSGNASVVSGASRSDLLISFIEVLEVGTGKAYSTLSSAINAAGSGDILLLGAETYTESGLTITDKSLSFIGQSAGTTIIQAASTYNTASDRVFNCSFSNYSDLNSLKFKNLTIRYGKVALFNGQQGAKGGGIFARNATVTMTNCELDSNSAATSPTDGWYGEGGGGIMLELSNLIADSSSFIGNIHNSASRFGDWMGGGAIAQIQDNAANYLTLTNCTFANNHADVHGGAIFTRPPTTSTILVTNCTFANNSGGQGGAFCTDNSSGNPQPIHFVNTIFYGNTATVSGTQLNAGSSTAFTFDNCLIQTIGDGSITGNYNNCIIGVDPLLGTVADNGGQTKTMALNGNSPAINAGTATGAPARDQRGMFRDAIPDIGAFEYGGILPVELTSFTATSTFGKVSLAWNTATEVNSSSFSIERKSPGSADWQTISSVKASGVSNSPRHYSYIDAIMGSGQYSYRLKIIDNDGSFRYSLVANAKLALPTKFELLQNYPNPFNPTTTISFGVPTTANVTVTIYNQIGAQVAVLANGTMEAGYHTLTWNAAGLASGMYLCELRSPGFTMVKKLLLVK